MRISVLADFDIEDVVRNIDWEEAAELLLVLARHLRAFDRIEMGEIIRQLGYHKDDLEQLTHVIVAVTEIGEP